MIHIGCHLSISKGFEAMGHEILSMGGDTFAFFTRNPRGGQVKELDPADVEALNSFLKEHSFAALVAHAPYTMNLCSDKDRAREYAEECFSEDLQKMELLPGNFFNFHPGNSLKQDREACMDRIAEILNRYIRPDQSTTVLLETMAGKGTEIGRTFEEIRSILDRVDEDKRVKVGVCFDTCHVWDAGYDIVNDLDGVLAEFDRIIGLQNLKAVHLNDSKNVCGSHKDRHEKLGAGYIGAEALRRVVTHSLLDGRPFILETPNERAGYVKEIAEVRGWEEAAGRGR
ncbi:MAG: deoxyribonuclease IV [Eubacteriales bacterium]|nr:deoxyribonuclease IV [Lachnospiraceae bacterium]MDD5859995.1 deoxyribonuclease IV [Eubacteriales bacterium]MCH4062872.1 deoxyribonuclease IV [Lachnospiraceae bacterium]MCH4104178.1 deoxyribonuclease IV [Lachnospiraceae bacterium]MCI1309983.1 deoxyribonuclease IV [Lachnospiraceae bacterium]